MRNLILISVINNFSQKTQLLPAYLRKNRLSVKKYRSCIKNGSFTLNQLGQKRVVVGGVEDTGSLAAECWNR